MRGAGAVAFAMLCATCGGRPAQNAPAHPGTLHAEPPGNAELMAPAENEGPQAGDEAPKFMADTLNAGACGAAKIDLDVHVGARAKSPKRAVILAFGASWCEPCKKQLPELQALAARYKATEVLAIYIITDDDAEGRAQMATHLVEEAKLTFPVVADDYQILSRRYGAGALPLLIVIDRYGRVAWRKEGYSEAAIGALRARIEDLVGN